MSLVNDLKTINTAMATGSGLSPDDYAVQLAQAILDALQVDFLGIAASESAMLALTGHQGDWCIRSDLSTQWVITGPDPSQLSSWTEIAYPVIAWDDITGKPSTFPPAAHVLDSASHTVSGLTAGHFLKALSASTFGFAAHGLTYSDVGAAAVGHDHDGTYLPVSAIPAAAAGWLHDDGAGNRAWTTPTKGDVGLGNVENTALSTWPGTSNLTTLGTIASGTWHGSAIADAYVAGAATWSAKQNAYANLTSIGSLANAAGWLHNNGSGTFAYSTPSKSDVGLSNVTNDAQTKASVVPNTAPGSGQILIGNAGGTAYAPVSVSGDAVLSSSGAITVSKFGGTSFGSAAGYAASAFATASHNHDGTYSPVGHTHSGVYAPVGAVTASGLTMATARLLGRTTAATGAIEEITVSTGLQLSAGALSCTLTGFPGFGTDHTHAAYGDHDHSGIYATVSHTQAVSTISDSTMVGQNLVKLANPYAVSFMRINADNSVSALVPIDFRNALELGTTSSVQFGALGLGCYPTGHSAYLDMFSNVTPTQWNLIQGTMRFAEAADLSACFGVRFGFKSTSAKDVGGVVYANLGTPTFENSGKVGYMYGIMIENLGHASETGKSWAIKIGNQSGAVGGSYVIETGTGIHSFGDNITIALGKKYQINGVDLAPSNIGAAAAGAITGSGLTMATARLLGRTNAAAGAIEEISAGSGLLLSAGMLSAISMCRALP